MGKGQEFSRPRRFRHPLRLPEDFKGGLALHSRASPLHRASKTGPRPFSRPLWPEAKRGMYRNQDFVAEVLQSHLVDGPAIRIIFDNQNGLRQIEPVSWLQAVAAPLVVCKKNTNLYLVLSNGAGQFSCSPQSSQGPFTAPE